MNADPFAHTLDVLEFEAVRRMLAERTVSGLGHERACALMPVSDLTVIQERLQTVSEMRTLLDRAEAIPLRGIRDIRPALQHARIDGALLDPPTLLDVASTLQVSRALRAFGKRLHSRLPSPRIEALAAGMGDFQDVEEAIDQAIDADGSVRDQASPALGRIRRDQHTMRERTREHLNRFIQSDLGRQALQEPVVTMRDGRYVVPVRTDHRHRVRGVVHDQSASGATLFIEPMGVVDLNNRLRELMAGERREIDRILEGLTARIRQHIEAIAFSVDLLAQFDYYHAAASLSLDLRAAPPRMNQMGHIALYNARHPLLALSADRTGSAVVPLTIELGGDAATLVITGPNMGGKTVALKTVGLLTLMAQAGLHVSADDRSELSVFTRIFADIGDEQSIQANLSTFSSHLRHIVAILEKADKRSLVLLDELGSGTDPTAGAALGMAILETLTGRGVVTLATTHYGALKDFAMRTEGVENGSMAFDVEALSPTYRFRQGIPGGSYAVEIGRRLGLSADILERTTRLIGKEERRLDELIVELDRERAQLQGAREEAERLRAELERLKTAYEERLAAHRQKERALAEQAQADAERMLRDARAAIERTVADLRAEQASRASIQRAQETLQDQRTMLRQFVEAAVPAPTSPSPAPPAQVAVGDRVWIERLQTTAVVLKDLGDRLRVQAGSLEMTVSRADVRPEPTPPPSPEISRSPAAVRIQGMTQARPELDVRGYTADEAVAAVDKYLDQAAVDGLLQVRILHGKGAGVLSREIRTFLQHHELVKAARFAPPHEGGTGVTIVELE